MTYRTAIIGTGAIAGAHAAAMAELKDRGRVVACVDMEPGRAVAFAQEWSIPAVYGSVEELLASEELDLVQVCTPPGAHVRLAGLAARAGIAVLVEKPPALSLAETDELIALQHDTGVPIMTVFQHRFGSRALQLRDLVRRGALGRPLVATCHTLWYRDDAYFDVRWRGRWEVEGGGPTMGHGIHQFDLLLSVLGGWEQVTAMAARQARPTDTEDVSMAIVRMSSGALASIVNSVVSPRETSVLRFDFERATVEVEHLYGHADRNWRFTAAPGYEGVEDVWGGCSADVPSGHVAQLAAIFDAFDAGVTPPVDAVEARTTMELIAAIYASAFTERPVASGEIGSGHPFATRMDGGVLPWARLKEAMA